MMDAVTAAAVRCVQKTRVRRGPPLWEACRRAFLDYLGAAFAAREEPAVLRLAQLVEGSGTVRLLTRNARAQAADAALFDGFLSHDLDFDDAEACVMGHISTAVFSALLAEAGPEDTWEDFYSAYLAGAELEGILGAAVNPAHKWEGFHPTATLGSIGAAAALARFRHLSEEETARVLSLAATQAAGLGLEAGSDGKPLHAGFAARNAVWALRLVRAGLTANDSPFNAKDGWVKTVCRTEILAEDIERAWLAPGHLLSPGYWMKEHGYCSAGITGAAACRALYEEGRRLEDFRRVTFHFPPGAGYSMHYTRPMTGQEGRFSMEYVAWQVLTLGDADDAYFKLEHVPEDFLAALPKFARAEDLPPVARSVRIVEVTAETKDGEVLTRRVPDPPGAPSAPFDDARLARKLRIGMKKEFAARLLSESRGRNKKLTELFSILDEEIKER